MSQHLMNTYARQPVCFVKGEGVWLWTKDGKKYLDALSGVAVNGLGHTHPKLIKACAYLCLSKKFFPSKSPLIFKL